MIESKLKAKNSNLVGSCQHGVAAARTEATGWLTDPTDRLLNALGNDLR